MVRCPLRTTMLGTNGVKVGVRVHTDARTGPGGVGTPKKRWARGLATGASMYNSKEHEARERDGGTHAHVGV